MREVVCGVFARDLVIGYVNAAWVGFARDNGAGRVWGPGDPLLDAMSEPLRGYHAERLATVLRSRDPWEHDYECSSHGVYRQFRLRAVAIGGGEGLLLSHSLRVERPHDRAGSPFDAAEYIDGSGFVKVCGHCRRARRAGGSEVWDWVPHILARPPENLSHGLCELCSAYYFGPEALGPP